MLNTRQDVVFSCNNGANGCMFHPFCYVAAPGDEVYRLRLHLVLNFCSTDNVLWEVCKKASCRFYVNAAWNWWFCEFYVTLSVEIALVLLWHILLTCFVHAELLLKVKFITKHLLSQLNMYLMMALWNGRWSELSFPLSCVLMYSAALLIGMNCLSKFVTLKFYIRKWDIIWFRAKL